MVLENSKQPDNVGFNNADDGAGRMRLLQGAPRTMGRACKLNVGAATVGVALAIFLAGCISQPIAPAVAVQPAPNKPLEVFQQEQVACMQYAGQQVAGGAEAANSAALGGVVVTTVLGAGLGAAVGGGSGAAIGAASGAVAGVTVGTGPPWGGQFELQRRYDIAYSQCMYAKGNEVPGYYYPPGPSAPPPPPPPPAGG